MTEFIQNIDKIKKCEHYTNNVEIFTECCNKYYDCHLCHNEDNDHQYKRLKMKKIRCVKCNTENNLGNKCINCNISFAKNHCNKCNVWCSKLLEFFHCDKCDSCKVGKKENFFHCDTCNICLSNNCKDSHECNKISKDNNCTICLNKIFSTYEEITIMKCNHIIHSKCLKLLVDHSKNNNKIASCTICKKSAVNFLNYEVMFDRYIKQFPMPEYYKDWTTDILCNDCNKKTNIKYHNMYSKCSNCRSYNTSILNVNRS